MSLSEEIVGRVKEFSLREGLLEKGDRVLCALSGGADSVALLKILLKLRGETGITVFAAHLNHGIRGSEADRDEEFCRKLCLNSGVELDCGKADVPALCAETGMGTEECARKVRYEFLGKCADKRSCSKIATAHHADDNIETVLLHMIRGSGLAGLVGIRPKRGKIIRPVLVCRKAELMAMAEEEGYEFVTDSTNAELDSTRNYIRHMILPHIYKLNESADKAFLRMCSGLLRDSEYIESEAGKIPDSAALSELSEIPEPVLVRYLMKKYRKCTGTSEKAPDSKSLRNIAEAIRDRKTVRYDVSGDVTVFLSRHGVDFEQRGNTAKKEFETELSEGENFISPIGYRILITADKKVADDWQNIYKLSICKSVNFDKISHDGKLSVVARNLRPEDRYTFSGYDRVVKKQLKKQGIPANRRRTTPCLCNQNGEIILVPGLDVADSYRLRKGGRAAYIVWCEEK